jgi:PIN domain nuclease of toxin-antitoxin system
MILLDTHVVIWLLTDEPRLSPRARNAIIHARATGDELGFSPVSLYEIAYAASRGRLPLKTPTAEFITAIQARLEFVSLTGEIAVRAAQLPEPFHGDPLDRIIVATAIARDCTLITHNGKIRDANACKTLW